MPSKALDLKYILKPFIKDTALYLMPLISCSAKEVLHCVSKESMHTRICTCEHVHTWDLAVNFLGVSCLGGREFV